jgi:hypothetical protein
MERETVWEQRLIARLRAMKGEDESYTDFGERVGLGQTMANKVLNGSRGIGPATLERIRCAQPALVAEVFLPDEPTTVAQD